LCRIIAHGDIDVVPLDVKTFLKPADSFRLMDPRDLHSQTWLRGTYEGKPLLLRRLVRVTGMPVVPEQDPLREFDEFAAYVLLKGTPGGGVPLP
jgi:hypothetical protein